MRFSKLNRSVLLVLLLGALIGISQACRQQITSTVKAPRGGIACAEPHAARAGGQILQQGGNAADALVAVAFAMAVTYPRAGNIGGGGFIVFRDSAGNVATLDFRETAPLDARHDMYWDDAGNPVAEKSQLGPLAAGVPGTVAGLFEFHRRYGSLPWEKLLEPAIRFARDGCEIDSSLSALLTSHRQKFESYPHAYQIFFPGGRELRPGSILRQPQLAATLQRIAREGAEAFYRGEIAAKMVEAVRQNGGIFTLEDFERYRPLWREPVQIDYRGWRIYSMPPPSSGGLVLQGILNTLSRWKGGKLPAHNSADYLALLAEIEKQWYANRNIYLGDPDFVDIPVEVFQSADSAARIAAAVSPDRPIPSEQLPQFRRMKRFAVESPQTTHISILDKAGNAVAMTYTLNGNFGSHFVAGETGVLLNNEMDDFAARPGYPNLYGLVQGEANAIAPGKRMLSSMTPAIVEQEGRLAGILGTPGGSTIITAVLQVLLNKIDFDMTLKDAQAAGRFHHQWLPDSVYVEESRIAPEVQTELRRRGFPLAHRKRLADIQAIWRSGPQWEISCDPRGSGIPLGY